jgi:hypothetical protein
MMSENGFIFKPRISGWRKGVNNIARERNIPTHIGLFGSNGVMRVP